MKLKNKKLVQYKGTVHDLTVENSHTYNIESVAVHNSVGGSLLAYCLEIINMDPIQNKLYFERFLNPSRNSPPDIDLDREMGSDEKVREFLDNKYGKERVASVITFGTFNEKGCLKDVARALGHDTGFESDVFAVTQEMPKKPTWDISLEQWFADYPRTKECSDRVRSWLNNPANDEIKKLTLKLQGQIRNLGQHAAGVVITPDDIWNYIPVNISKGNIVTAFQEAGSGKDLSSLGILKLDNLKLETLNVLKLACKLVKEKKGIDIKYQLNNLDLKDANLYTELLLGNNQGIFQFESEGITRLAKDIKVESFDEVVVTTSLYRPGPMGIGAHDEYIRNKFYPEQRSYVHPILKPLLEDSNGVLVFQEQLMFMANEIAGMSLGEGDNLRKVMDSSNKIIKKKSEGEKLTEEEENNKNYKQYKELWAKFIDGAKAKGLNESEVAAIEEWLIKYLGYSFNASHAKLYSYITCQTLFLRHYYPAEFFTALLNHPKSNNDKDKEQRWLSSAILAAMSKGIKITQPTRKSGWEWTMIDDQTIAMGMSGIDGMGEIAFKELSEAKIEHMSKEDFFAHKFSKFNKRSFESCVKAGLFDDWSDSRAELIALRGIKIKSTKQLDIFGKKPSLEDGLNGQTFESTSMDQKYREFMDVCKLDLNMLNRISNIKKMFFEEYKIPLDSVTNYEDQQNFYYFLLERIEERTGRMGKKFYTIHISDGIFAKRLTMWEEHYKKVQTILIPGHFYVTKFLKEKDEKGREWLTFNRNAQFRQVD
jgi:DNA polymerase-3 subunit alpha